MYASKTGEATFDAAFTRGIALIGIFFLLGLRLAKRLLDYLLQGNAQEIELAHAVPNARLEGRAQIQGIPLPGPAFRWVQSPVAWPGFWSPNTCVDPLLTNQLLYDSGLLLNPLDLSVLADPCEIPWVYNEGDLSPERSACQIYSIPVKGLLCRWMLSKGPFARTYWGELDGERVSIMVIPGTSAVYLQEFLRDTAFLKEQDSPNIVKIRGAVVTPMALLIVNECMAKGDLHSIIQENAYDQRQLWIMANEISEALNYLHNKNIVHTNLTSWDIFVTEDWAVRIANIGLIRFITGSDQCQQVPGRSRYLAPERLRGRPATFKSDIYALGVILLELYTGPDQASSSQRQEAWEEVPSTIHTVIRQCLQDNPEHRPTAASVLDIIAQAYDV